MHLSWSLCTLAYTFMYLGLHVYVPWLTRLPGESYRRRLGSLLLYLCYVFRALITPVCVDRPALNQQETVCYFNRYFQAGGSDASNKKGRQSHLSPNRKSSSVSSTYPSSDVNTLPANSVVLLVLVFRG